MAGLNASPRPLKGRCARCHFQQVCNGNTRVRAQQVFHDPWQEDPGCYLDEDEITGFGPIAGPALRLAARRT